MYSIENFTENSFFFLFELQKYRIKLKQKKKQYFLLYLFNIHRSIINIEISSDMKLERQKKIGNY